MLQTSFFLVFSVAAMLSALNVNAQSTVDDSSSCESSTLSEAVNLIRDLKNLFGSYQPKDRASCASKADLEDLKATFTSNRQRFTSSLREYTYSCS